MFQMPMLPQPDSLASLILPSSPATATDIAAPSPRRDEHVDPVRQLERVAAEALAAFTTPEGPGLQHRCSSALHDLFAAIEHAEAQLAPEDILKRLQLVRRAIANSPLSWRLQNWPRGYQGDFETIEMMCRGDSVSLLTGAPRAIEQ